MLAARSAAEVAPRQQDRRAAIARLVQLEFGIFRAVFPAAPIEEQELAEAGPLDALEKLLGNDLIGIDIGAVHRRDQAGDA